MHTSKYAHKKELLHWEKEAMDTQSEYILIGAMLHTRNETYNCLTTSVEKWC